MKKILIYAAILIPIIAFYVFVAHNAYNIGWNDDWHGIEGFLVNWQQQATFSEKISLLFSQMCEHRILYVRLSTLFAHALFGEVNYKTMMLMGVAYLLILPFVFYRILREINLGLAYLIPLIFLVFNIQPIENIFWAITSLQPNVVIIFGLLGFALLLFYQKNWAFYLANLLFFIAMFTNGNGMFAFLAAIPIVLFVRTKSENYQYLFILAFSFFLYFFNFKKPGIRPDVLINFTQYPHIIIADFFAFFGSPIDSTIFFYNLNLKYTLAIVAGILMMLFILAQLTAFIWGLFDRNKSYNKGNSAWGKFANKVCENIYKKPKFNLFLLASFIFVALSGAAFSASRASQGLEQAFASRYKTVSLILFAIVYLASFNVINKKSNRKFLAISIVVGAIFSLLSYYEAWGEVENRRKFFATTILNWKNNGRYFFYAFPNSRNPDDHEPIKQYKKLPIMPYNYAGFVPNVMKQVNDILWISRVYYKNYTPPTEIDSLNNDLYKKQTIENASEKVLISEEKNLYKISISDAFCPANKRFEGYYVLCFNEKNRLTFPLPAKVNKLSTFFQTQQYYNSQIENIVAKPDLPAGKFQMQIGKLENNHFKVLKEQTIIIN